MGANLSQCLLSYILLQEAICWQNDQVKFQTWLAIRHGINVFLEPHDSELRQILHFGIF